MILDVTQDLAVRVAPVNNPRKFNEYNEQQGYYRAYVTANNAEAEHRFAIAESEWSRGIVDSSVGCGAGPSPVIAIATAIFDYETKYAPLCTTDTEER